MSKLKTSRKEICYAFNEWFELDIHWYSCCDFCCGDREETERQVLLERSIGNSPAYAVDLSLYPIKSLTTACPELSRTGINADQHGFKCAADAAKHSKTVPDTFNSSLPVALHARDAGPLRTLA